MVKSHIWYLLLVLILVFQHNSCTVEKFPYDKSILKHRKNFITSFSIRLNGYYFRKNQNDNIVRYFFDNGYCFFDGTNNSIDSIDCFPIETRARFIPYGWGVYYLEKDTLIAHRIWGGGRDKFQMFKSEELRAKVLNDSTLLFFSRKNIFNQVLTTQDTFCFRRCTEVPSSFNVLMKDE